MWHFFCKWSAWRRTNTWHAESSFIPSTVRETRTCSVCGDRDWRYLKISRAVLDAELRAAPQPQEQP